ncbi:PrgI family protein [Gordonibacter pamelaeae]|nr:PrgI family protein [Gordonibacter pamelaeae]
MASVIRGHAVSLQIPIQKDIGEYQEKIVGKMSLRTLVCVAGGFACAIASACIVYFVFHIEVGSATLPVMAAALPFWLAGFWRPFGMKLEEFLPYLLDHHFGSTRLLYASPQQAGEPIQAGPIPGKPSRKSKRKAKRKGAERHEPSRQAA